MSTTIITDTNCYTLSADCWGINYSETKETPPIIIVEYRIGNIIATDNIKVFSNKTAYY